MIAAHEAAHLQKKRRSDSAGNKLITRTQNLGQFDLRSISIAGYYAQHLPKIQHPQGD